LSDLVAPGLLEGSDAAGNGCVRLFSAGGAHQQEESWPKSAFASRSKIAGLRHPPLTLRPSAPLRVLARSARRQVIAAKAAMGAADPAKDLFS
jgi:hypothetical protein